MAYRGPEAAPESSLTPERRGPVVGRFCKACNEVYSLHAAKHRGKPIHGKDHVSAPCAEEGEDFAPGAPWWEPAVAVLPPAPVAATS